MTKKKELRVENAKERQLAYNKLTTREKLERHNSLISKEHGKKQRHKLQEQLAKEVAISQKQEAIQSKKEKSLL